MLSPKQDIYITRTLPQVPEQIAEEKTEVVRPRGQEDCGIFLALQGHCTHEVTAAPVRELPTHACAGNPKLRELVIYPQESMKIRRALLGKIKVSVLEGWRCDRAIGVRKKNLFYTCRKPSKNKKRRNFSCFFSTS